MAIVDYAQQLHPQMAAVLEKQAKITPGAKKVHTLTPDQARAQYATARAYWNADAPAIDEIVDTSVEGTTGTIPVRVYRHGRDRCLPALIYLHGGGWVVGNLDTHDKIMRLLALRSGAAVVGVDYSLAPQTRFPTAIDECLDVVIHVRGHGSDWGIDAERIALGGDSAGANLSMAVPRTGTIIASTCSAPICTACPPPSSPRRAWTRCWTTASPCTRSWAKPGSTARSGSTTACCTVSCTTRACWFPRRRPSTAQRRRFGRH